MIDFEPHESIETLEDTTFVLLPDDFTLDLSRPVEAPARFPELAETEELEDLEECGEYEDLEEWYDPEDLREAEESIDRELDEELAFAAAERGRRLSLFRLVRVLAVIIVLAVPAVVYVGRAYYALPLAARPFHGMHALLRPSGHVGLSAGVLGTLLIVASLIYLVRKHITRSYQGLRWWMTCHVVTGLIGPVLIVLHSAFLPTSALGQVALGAMLVVVLSGVLGRYILLYMPRALEGSEAARESVRSRLQVYQNKLVALGLDPRELQGTTAEHPERRRPWLVTAAGRVLLGDRRSRREYRRLRQVVRRHRGLGEEARVVLVLVRRLCRERQLYVRWHELRRIVGTWRFLHQWLAVILLSGAFFHIVLAIRHGGLWILGGRD